MRRLFRQEAYPENTLTDYEAFTILLGSRFIRFEAKVTKDGGRIVMADATLLAEFDAKGTLLGILGR